MGHGYVSVFGYGIVVNVTEFIKVFPGTFELVRDLYQDNDDAMEEILDKFGEISFHYEGHGGPEQLFITTSHSIVGDGGSNHFREIDYEAMKSGLDVLSEWINKYFNGKQPKLMLFCYQTN